MNRPLVIGVIGGVIVIAAIALTLLMDLGPDTRQEASVAVEPMRPVPGGRLNAPGTVGPPRNAPPLATGPRGTPPAVSGQSAPPIEVTRLPPPATQPDSRPASPAARPADRPAQAAATPPDRPATESRPAQVAPGPVPPTFDVVRVNPRGETVIAGRAAPNAEVTIADGTGIVGKTKADRRGEWVVVPDKPLKPGGHEIVLSAESEGGATAQSENKIVLVVPERGRDIAGRETKESSGALALSVPREGMGPSVVLQKPSPGATAPAQGRGGPVVVRRTPEEMEEIARRLEQPEPRHPEAGRGAAGGKGPSRAGGKSGSSSLSLDAIDYDNEGNVAMSGQAPSGAKVNVYIDNEPIGDATTGEEGVWRLAPSTNVPPGRYTMRVDQVDDRGKVLARIETPFVRAMPLGDLPRGAVVFVQPGNSLWRIARRTYGQGVQFTVIYEANREQIKDPDLIYPGQIFRVPRVN